jgi:3-oxoacyl-[acyl-carrier-protein] synthase-3
MTYSKIISTGRYVPDKVVTNEDLSKIVDTSDEWIYTRSGIKERRISQGEDLVDFSTKAAINALEKGNIDPESIDLIIVATTSPQNFVPSTACCVQSEIKAVNATAFDIFAACTGLIFGMEIANNFINSGKYKRALVIGAELLSKITDWQDRSTCVLFGDGASCIVMEKSVEYEGIKSISINSDGSLGENLTCSTGYVETPFGKFNENIKDKVYMNGKEIFKFAVSKAEKSITKILEDNNLTIEDIDHVVCHQANMRIIQSSAKKTGIPKEKFYLNLEHYGNTSSASIGIALDEMIEKGIINNGEKVIIVAFGGGLTWGSALLEFDYLN